MEEGILLTSIEDGTFIQLEKALIKIQKNHLVVTTGKIERQWVFTKHGMTTVSLISCETGTQWVKPSTMQCDWEHPDGSGISEGKIVSIRFFIGNDEGLGCH